ncbi:unnamed protein product [Cyprideis torosa]|uniref:Uncharacterized protein n=1 Tax=Cyprideis torosa TaxID=163714 RepID=A0A7R8W668_9CRUS|nr:unnamed protein product [Cyprideis torosa]CAG0886061.1 unnamed protein product [Cyprideis torosa]
MTNRLTDWEQTKGRGRWSVKRQMECRVSCRCNEKIIPFSEQQTEPLWGTAWGGSGAIGTAAVWGRVHGAFVAAEWYRAVVPLVVYASLAKGVNPVVGAKVTAKVTRRTPAVMDNVSLELLDDGMGDLNLSNFQVVPLVVYASLAKGVNPVVGAKVTAKVTRRTPAVMDNVSLELLDDGMGVPDIQMGDGVYSGYVTQFFHVPSDYEIQVYARNGDGSEFGFLVSSGKTAVSEYCCGYRPSSLQLGPLGALQRQAPGPTLHLTHAPQDDIFPPSKVMDLRVETEHDRGHFRFSWTAPGANYNVGSALRYELRYARDLESLTAERFLSATQISTATPLTAGSKEQVMASVGEYGLDYGKVYFFAVRAFHGQWSPISHPVSAALTPPPSMLSANADNLTLFASTTWTNDDLFGGMRVTELVAIATGVIAFIVLSIACTVFYCMKVQRSRGKRAPTPPDSPKADPDLILSQANLYPDFTVQIKEPMMNGGGTTKQFISASELLNEHERRQSQAEAIYANSYSRSNGINANPSTTINGSLQMTPAPPEYLYSRPRSHALHQSYEVSFAETPSHSDGSVQSDPVAARNMYNASTTLPGGYKRFDRNSFPRGGSLGGPPIVPPKPSRIYEEQGGVSTTAVMGSKSLRISYDLNDSHSSTGSDRKIWNATQV